LFDNDELTTCKEAMMGPDSVKWLEAIKSVIVPYMRNQVSELGKPSKGMKPNKRIWIYKQIWMFSHLRNSRHIVKRVYDYVQ
jgi:hypothetical protein